MVKKILKKFKVEFLTVLFLSLILAFFEITTLSELGFFISSFGNSSSEKSNFLISSHFNFAHENFAKKHGLFILVLFVIKFLLFVWINVEINKFVSKLDLYARQLLLTSYSSIKYRDWIKLDNSEVISDITSFIPKVVNNFILPFIRIVPEAIILFSIVILLAFVDIRIFLISSISFIILCLLYIFIFRIKLFNLGMKMRDINLNMAYFVKLSFESFKEFSVSGNRSYFIKKFVNLSQPWKSAYVSYNTISKMPKVIIELVFVILFVFIIITIEDLDNSMYVISLFGICGIRSIPIFTTILSFFNNYRTNLPLIFRLESKYKHTFSFTNKETPPVHFQKLHFNKVCFSYTDDSEIIKDLSFTINKKDRVLFKGESGSGKSTLINLVLGHLEPKSGSITFNNCEENGNFNFYYLPQESFLFSASIIENVTLTTSNDYNKEVFSKCLIDTQLDKIVLNLRDGVHTKLSDKALNLSGGQRQRILLARALYQRPSIIILDESTNAIDFNSQNEIFDTIFSEYCDTTFIVVCHTEINLKLFNNIICI